MCPKDFFSPLWCSSPVPGFHLQILKETVKMQYRKAPLQLNSLPQIKISFSYYSSPEFLIIYPSPLKGLGSTVQCPISHNNIREGSQVITHSADAL